MALGSLYREMGVSYNDAKNGTMTTKTTLENFWTMKKRHIGFIELPKEAASINSNFLWVNKDI